MSESWREFFEGYRPGGANLARPTPAVVAADPIGVPSTGAEASGNGTAAPKEALRTPTAPAAPTAAAPKDTQPKTGPSGPPTIPLRGAAARIVANMKASLEVPTATSFRVVPARLLEVNRRILNNQLARTGAAGKVSFTHLIGYAVVQALEAVPALNSTFVPAGPDDPSPAPSVIHHEHVGLGYRRRPAAQPTAAGPCWCRSSRTPTPWTSGLLGRLRGSDPQGPDQQDRRRRLRRRHGQPDQPGDHRHRAVGAPAHARTGGHHRGRQPSTTRPSGRPPTRGCWPSSGVSKVVTVTSTYDHRIIQGAESGLFLQRVHRLLTGEDGFYERVFQAMGVPYEPVQYRRDVNDPRIERRGRIEKQIEVDQLINMYRVRGHLIAHLDPLDWKAPHMHAELDPATYGLTRLGPRAGVPTDGLARRERMRLGDILGVLRDAYCRTVGVEYMHIQEPDQKRWIQEHVEGVSTELEPEEHRQILEPA